METKIFVLRDYKEQGVISASDERLIEEAARIISDGGLLAFPTETVYGLGASALASDAARRIYSAKGRPSDNPLIVHIAHTGDLDLVAEEVSDAALNLAEAWWPGPLTMVLGRAMSIPREVTGGLDTVAVRCPSHPVARLMIEYAGVPVAAPSANISGSPSTTSAAHCIADLNGLIDGCLDAGDSEIGLESTIIDMSGPSPILLRPGAITGEMLEETLGVPVSADDALKGPLGEDAVPRAPGMKYRHYAPRAEMAVVAPGPRGSTARRILEVYREAARTHRHIAILCSTECAGELMDAAGAVPPDADIVINGSREDTESVARGLFTSLREIDKGDTDYIIAEGVRDEGMGCAVMNRLCKASGWNII